MSLQITHRRTALVLVAYLAASWIVAFGHVHEHGHGATGPHACVTPAHSHCHHDHGHHHGHHDYDTQHPASEESAPQKAPVHDDDCAACQYQLFAVAYLAPPPQLIQPHTVEASRLDESRAVPALALQALRSRGPPTCC